MNRPPAYTTLPTTWSERTEPFTPGRNAAITAPVVASSATKRLRVTPSTAVKSPPT
ncbi:MAG: hypothetical protein IPJ14_15225 [Kineosporiaceae bacterium]|nr:hypothetical protein [Kineosporiaceae bacterium]